MLTTLATTLAINLAMALPGTVTAEIAEPPPDGSWDEPAKETADASEEPASDAAPVQPTQPLEPAKPLTIDDIEIPQKKGIGMMATAGALGLVSVGVMGWRMARVKQSCRADDRSLTLTEDDLEGLGDEFADCFAGLGGNALLWSLQALPNAVNFGLAPGAATLRAKYDAARSAKTGEVQRNPNVFIGSGAALLSAGVVGRVIVAVVRVRSFNPERGTAERCLDGERQAGEFFDCYSTRTALQYGMHQLSSASIAAGAGLLAYGVVYKRERRKYENGYGAEPVARFEWSIQPDLSLDYTGAAAKFRF